MAKLVSDNDDSVCVFEDSFKLVHGFQVVDLGEDSYPVASF